MRLTCVNRIKLVGKPMETSPEGKASNVKSGWLL
jgi:hypothetical protein